MRCPYCGNEDNRVVDTRLAREGEEIRRRRECEECTRRFTTRERLETVTPRIIKKDERREEYDRGKLLLGIENACVKRPVSTDAIERILDRVEKRLQESGEKEISSRILGERVLDELRALDPLAAVRWASVFLDFQSVEDYAEFFSTLEPSKSDES